MLMPLQPAGGSSGLEKLTIYYEKKWEKDWLGSVEALFNPQELQISRSVNWETIGGEAVGEETTIEQQFRTISPQSMSIDLFFDTYERHKKSLFGALPSLNPFPLPKATDVRQYTKKLAKLAQVNAELHRPPLCKLEWGKFDNLFVGVLTGIEQKFTMFMPNGMPVRATVTCSFIEHETTGTELHSADIPKLHTVNRSDSLHSIAAQMYNDPSQWRRIARANQIVNPRKLKPGMVLIIPTNL